MEEEKSRRTGPLDEIETIDRDALTFDDERKAAAIERENKRVDEEFKKNVSGLGISSEDVSRAVGFKTFMKHEAEKVMILAIAGSTSTVLKLPGEIDRIMLRLEQVRCALIGQGADVTDENRMQLAEEEKSLVEQLVAVGNLQRNVAREAVDAQAKLAMVNFRIKNGGMKRAKPAFQHVGEEVNL